MFLKTAKQVSKPTERAKAAAEDRVTITTRKQKPVTENVEENHSKWAQDLKASKSPDSQEKHGDANVIDVDGTEPSLRASSPAKAALEKPETTQEQLGKFLLH